MASCSDLSQMSPLIESRPITKATPVILSSSKKFVEPFNRLKNRANLFRRKNFSSQINISSSNNSSSINRDHSHIIPSNLISSSSSSFAPNYNNNNNAVILKRSNSMVCPQQRLQTLLNHHRNSVCLELDGCSTDESSTDDYQLIKSSSSSRLYSTNTNNRIWKQTYSTMSDIDEHETPPFPLIVDTTTPLPSAVIEESIVDEFVDHQTEKREVSSSSSSSLPNNNNNSEQPPVILFSPEHQQPTNDVIEREEKTPVTTTEEEEQEQVIPLTSSTAPITSSSHSSSSSSSTVLLRDRAETIRSRRQCHSSISLLQHQQSISSSSDEPFFDCKQPLSTKTNLLDTATSTMFISSSSPSSKVSACTMTGKSLINLDECSSSSSSSEKAVQTITVIESNTIPMPCVKRAISSTSLSSSSASIQTDSLEKKPKMPTSISTTTEETTTVVEPKISQCRTTTRTAIQHQSESFYKWPHIRDRLLGEQACIYWVNYLGSTAIKMSNDGTTAMPSHAIARLKQSTQYARVLPIIGLSISSRGVEFLKHTKERIVICFHDIKSIHCACQDQDLRYFAYVTREQRLVHGMSPVAVASSAALDNKQHAPPSPSLSIGGDYHHYCHVFVVKSEAMSTEIMLTFGQVFDIAYRIHRRLQMNGKKAKETYLSASSNMTNSEQQQQQQQQQEQAQHHPHLEVVRLSTKSDTNTVMSSSTHSPTTSSSSSSIEDRKIFV